MAPIPRARARGARRWRRELGGGVRQHPGSTTALRGLMASLALRSARPWRAMSMRDRPAGCASCAGAPVRRSEGQRAAAARRPTSIVCWWRSFVGGERAMLAAPRRRSRPRARRSTNRVIYASERRLNRPRAPHASTTSSASLRGPAFRCSFNLPTATNRARFAYPTSRTKHSIGNSGASVDLRRRQVWMLHSCRGEWNLLSSSPGSRLCFASKPSPCCVVGPSPKCAPHLTRI